MILQSLIQPKATYQNQKIALKLLFLVDMQSASPKNFKYGDICLLECIHKPAASYILSFVSEKV